MKRTVIIFIVAVSMLISSICFAGTQMTGVATAFDPHSGRLVLQTQSGAKTTVSIPQTVKVYLMSNTEAIEGAEAWKILENNLFKGTKVQVDVSGRTAFAIRILEVPV